MCDGQRQLHEDPVDLGIGVQARDEREHLLLARLRGQPDVARVDARLGRGLVLRADVDVRGRVVADEHRREADVPELRRPPRATPDAHPRGELLPVHAHGRHRRRLYAKASSERVLNRGVGMCR